MNYGIIVIIVIKHYVQKCRWHDLLKCLLKTLYYILSDISCLLYFYPIHSIKYLFWYRFQFHIQSADAFNPVYGKCLFHWTEMHSIYSSMEFYGMDDIERGKKTSKSKYNTEMKFNSHLVIALVVTSWAIFLCALSDKKQ